MFLGQVDDETRQLTETVQTRSSKEIKSENVLSLSFLYPHGYTLLWKIVKECMSAECETEIPIGK